MEVNSFVWKGSTLVWFWTAGWVRHVSKMSTACSVMKPVYGAEAMCEDDRWNFLWCLVFFIFAPQPPLLSRLHSILLSYTPGVSLSVSLSLSLSLNMTLPNPPLGFSLTEGQSSRIYPSEIKSGGELGKDCISRREPQDGRTGQQTSSTDTR